MTFSDPLYLLLLIPALAWSLWIARGIHGITRPRRRLAVALRVLVTVLLVLALAGLQTVRVNRGISTVFVLDRSASIDDTARHGYEQFIAKSLEALGPNDNAGLVVFGKDPVIDSDTGTLRSLGRIYASPDNSATDIASAIRLASATLLEGSAKRLVLLSDGNETSGDAAEAAQVAAADGVQIDVAPSVASLSDRGEVLVQNVDTPSEVTRGQPFELRVVAQATQAASGTLHIDRDGVPVSDMDVNLIPGTNVIAVSETAADPGFYKYRASLNVSNDTDPRNNVGIGFVNVRGRPRVLLVEGQPGSAAALETALKPHDIDVHRTGIEGLPTRPEDLQSYDSMILSDFPAQGITDPQMAMIASAVRDSGLGFGMIGGENSFLPGGYYATPIADVLPVDMNIRQRKVYPSTCIEIVIDASGSMAMDEDGVEKVKIAATAAAAIVRMMTPKDLIGIAGSTDDIRFVAPIQPCVDKDAVVAQAGKIEAGGGGIYITPSLQFAYKTLTPVDTKVRHLILMADGDDSEDQGGALALAQQMVSKGMTISVIAVGDGKDVPFLKALAAVGKGYFYLASQAKQIQRLVTKDTSIMSRSAIEEGAFLPKVDPNDEVLRGLDLQSMPALFAYDLTSDRPLARTPMRTGKDDPLLAYWQYGLGTSMAFTSDAQPKWARRWMGWSDFNSFWAQAIRATMRQTSSDRIQMSMHREGGGAVLGLTAFDPSGAAINGLQAKVNVISPDGKSQPVAIQQTGPGRYSAKFDAGQTGAYIVTAAQQTAGTAKPLVTRAGFSVAYPPEYQSVGPNSALLAEIAKTTGGEMLQRPVQAFRPTGKPGKSVRDLWPDLLLASALLFVLDIAVRRLAIPFGEIIGVISIALAPALARMGMRRSRQRSAAPQAQSIARLNSAKQQVIRRPSDDSLPEGFPIGGSVSPSAATTSSTEPVVAGDRQTELKRESSSLNTTQRLLEMKRRKGGDDR